MMALMAFIAGIVTGMVLVLEFQRVRRERRVKAIEAEIAEEEEIRLGGPLHYQVMDGDEVLLNTDDLKEAKTFRTEARDEGFPARLIDHGKDRG